MTRPRQSPAASPAVGELIDVTIEKGVYRGLGLGRVSGRVCLVERALPGDRLAAEILEVHRGYVRGRVRSLHSAGPSRRTAPCPHAAPCGGCSYQELTYEGQLQVKTDVLRESLRRAGVEWGGDLEIVPSPETGWRSRATLHFAVRSNELILGLRGERSHDVVRLETCQQLSSALMGVARGLRSALGKRRHVWEHLRDLVLAESADGQTRVARLETTVPLTEAGGLEGVGERLELTGYVLGGVGRDGKGEDTVLRGDPHVEHDILDVALRADVSSFFQANRFLVEPVVREVLRQVPVDGAVLELYAGVGLFTVPLAARGQAVTAVEIATSAVADLRHNTERLTHARVVEGDVARCLGRIQVSGGETVLVDPPRSGLGTFVVGAVAARRPARIVYLSCDPTTLARDLARFQRQGFSLRALRAFDLFPTTFHIEALATLDLG